MRALLHAGGKEIPVEVLVLGPLGAELSCPEPPAEPRLQLQLLSGEVQLNLPAEVLRRSPDRLWLAFDDTDLGQQALLDRFCAAFSAGAEVLPDPAPPPASPLEPTLRVQLSWTPPVTQEVAAAERADRDPAPAPPPPARVWTTLPTITPPAPPAPAPAAAPAAAPAPAAIAPEERRTEERHEKSIPVKFDNLTSLIKEFTHNISFGGLFVYTEREFHAGEPLDITLIHPLSGERITLAAQVVHAASAAAPDPLSGRPRFGVGVQFRLPPEELKAKLADFIDSRQRQLPELRQLLQEAHRLLQSAAAGPRALLGVGPTAEAEEIRSAYFRLVDHFHPDRYRGKLGAAELRLLDELFRRLTAAYETLQER